MSDLILINPSARGKIYQGLGIRHTAIEPPLWCRLIAGYCQDQGYSVDIIDVDALDLESPEVARRVLEFNPRLCVVAAYGHQPSASTQQMTGAIEILRLIRSEERRVGK